MLLDSGNPTEDPITILGISTCITKLLGNVLPQWDGIRSLRLGSLRSKLDEAGRTIQLEVTPLQLGCLIPAVMWL